MKQKYWLVVIIVLTTWAKNTKWTYFYEEKVFFSLLLTQKCLFFMASSLFRTKKREKSCWRKIITWLFIKLNLTKAASKKYPLHNKASGHNNDWNSNITWVNIVVTFHGEKSQICSQESSRYLQWFRAEDFLVSNKENQYQLQFILPPLRSYRQSVSVHAYLVNSMTSIWYQKSGCNCFQDLTDEKKPVGLTD